MEKKEEKEKVIKMEPKYKRYLDRLDDAGLPVSNVRYLMAEFGLSQRKAKEVVIEYQEP